MKVFGENLKKARESQGLTQTYLARSIGLTSAAYSFYEQGVREPNLTNLVTLSLILNVSVDALLGLSNDSRITNDTKIELAKIRWRVDGFDAEEDEDGNVTVTAPKTSNAKMKLPREQFIRLTEGLDRECKEISEVNFKGLASVYMKAYQRGTDPLLLLSQEEESSG